MSNFDRGFLKFFNKSFWIGLLVGFTSVVGFVAHQKEFWPFFVNQSGVEEKAEQLGVFLEGYQKTLKSECRNSSDDVDKLLYFNLYRATSRYFKEMSRCFDEAAEMKEPVDQDRLKNFLDELDKERERRENKVKI